MKFLLIVVALLSSMQDFNTLMMSMDQTLMRRRLTLTVVFSLLLLSPSRHMGPDQYAPKQYGCDQGSFGEAEGLV